MSEVLLVCVPGVRLDEAGGLLRVVLVPRLSGLGTELDAYGLDQWPAIIAAARFAVTLDGAAATLDLPVVSDVSADVWRAFFAPGTDVREWTGQTTYDPPVVAPSSDQADEIDKAYRRAATGMGEPAAVAAAYSELELPPSEEPIIPFDDSDPTFVPPDFHQTVANLREHPRVQRSLGLIVDVLIPRQHLPNGARGEISASWSNPPAGLGSVVSPRTSYEVEDNRFLAASTPTHRGGLVDLTTRSTRTIPDGTGGEVEVEVDDWLVTSLDVEAGVTRLGAVGEAVAAGSTPELPALRTAGLSLLRRGLEEELGRRSRNGSANRDAAELPTLSADDLVLGYRLDVKRSGATSWFPLCRRVATYRVNGQAIGDGADVEESHVKAAAVVRSSDRKLRTDETVARWAGWSLAVPRPAFARPPDQPPPQRRRRLPYDFSWVFELDPTTGGLPMLRFGRTYVMRLRVADLAGGGLELDDEAGDVLATAGHTFARREPVPPPEIPPPAGYVITTAEGRFTNDPSVLGPGGSAEVLVIRSDPNADAGMPAMLEYPANERRRLLPPPTNEALTSYHGVLARTGEAAVEQGRRLRNPPTFRPESEVPPYSWLPDPAAEGVAVVGVPAARRRRPTPVAVRAWGEDTWPDHPPKALVLGPGSGPSVAVELRGADRIAVELPPAHEATVQISSTLTEGFLDQMAAGLWISGITGAGATAFQGRHPMITPWRTVRVVHAVRRPLGTPAGPLVADRVPGATAAHVHPAPADPLAGIDPDSTARVGVQASWEEWGDAPDTTDQSEVLEPLAVTVDDEALAPIRHEFADTKYRQVTYRLEARSRFREYFGAEPDASFVTEDALGPVDVPSTARPIAPMVRSVVPAFRWETRREGDRFIRVRRGGRLRVELARPWYTTGEGEVLGVVLAVPRERWAEAPLISADHPRLYTTQHRDPIYVGGRPEPFPTVASVVDGVEVVPDSYPVAVDADSGVTVAVAPVPVWFGADRWWADVILDGPPPGTVSTNPFIRLALARYQPNSLAGLELSPIVTSELVPVLQDRTLDVTQTSAGPTVQLAAEASPFIGNAVEISVEVRNPTAGESTLTELDGEAQGAGWTRVPLAGGQSKLRIQVGETTAPLGGIAPAGDTRAWRLVVREVEDLETFPPDGSSELTAELAPRTVFADSVPLRVDATFGLTPHDVPDGLDELPRGGE